MSAVSQQISLSSSSQSQSNQYKQDFQELKSDLLIQSNYPQNIKSQQSNIRNSGQLTNSHIKQSKLNKPQNQPSSELNKQSPKNKSNIKQLSSSSEVKNKNHSIENDRLKKQKQIQRKVSDIINKKSYIDQQQLHNQPSASIYENDFEQNIEDVREEMEEIKSEFESEKRDEVGEDLEESIEVVSEIIESNDPQLAKFNKPNRGGSKKDKSASKEKDKDAENNKFLKKKNQEGGKSEKDMGSKNTVSRQKSAKKLEKKDNKIPQISKQIEIDSTGKTASGLTKQQIQRHNALKQKKKKQQQQKLQKEAADKQEAKAQQKLRRKQIAEKMKKIAQQTNQKLRKKEEEEQRQKENEKSNQRGASRRKSVVKKGGKNEDDNKSVVSINFGEDERDGDQAVAHTMKQKQKEKSISMVKTELSVMERLKNGLAKKKEFDKQIKNEIVDKLHKLKQNPKQLKPEQIKQLRNQLKQDQKKHKMGPQILQQQQQSTTKAKQLKNSIKELRSERHKLKERIIEQEKIKARFEEKIKALEGQQNIIVLDKNKKQYTSFGLVQDLKKVANTLHVDEIIDKEHYDVSNETPIQKFTNFFFKQNYEQNEIFNILNVNDDDILTLKEIEKVCKQLNIGLTDKQLKQVFRVLDYDSSGSLSKDEFEYIIGKQIETKVNLKKILGKIDVENPLEIQERILDLRSRIKYMEKFVTENEQATEDPNYSSLIRKIDKYTTKLERRKESTKASQSLNIISLKEELRLLEVEKDNEERIGDIVKQQIGTNIKDKSEFLKRKVQEQLQCREKLYQAKNEFQQLQLRYITLDKIVKTKQRHISQGNQQEKEQQAELRAATEYRNKIMNKKMNSASTPMDELLAATLMIQRNFRKKKAMKEFDKLKEEKKTQEGKNK